jgi:hypothetical protein
VASKWVSPNFTRQDPSAWREKPGVRLTFRISSGVRFEGRMGSAYKWFQEKCAAVLRLEPRKRKTGHFALHQSLKRLG